jgi:protein SEY1
MSEGAAHPCLHLIDDDGRLVSRDELNTFLESALSNGSPNTTPVGPLSRVKKCGTKYHVVGVFGGQSSGKSTLLNNLFGTKFEVMQDNTGRHQTTKGAFLAKYQPQGEPSSTSASGSDLFVIDFEGTDGMERGEDQSFERQLSLFALSVADVLVINMWANDVGRYNAANMSLLRTIFEVNLQLFAHDSYTKDEKPTLLIALRDFTETDLQRYTDIVMTALNKTWDSITKPQGFEDCPITALFQVRFHGLPHYKLQRSEFDAEMKQFRRWFLDTLSPKYLFDSTVSYRHIPLEALSSYFDNCWSSIQTSRDLDIPTQRDLVARHRCSELFDAAVANFSVVVDERAAQIKAGKLCAQLEAALHHAADASNAEFNLHTKLYARKVVAEFSSKLSHSLDTKIAEVVALQTAQLVTECLRNVEDDVQSIVDDAFKQLYRDVVASEGKTGAEDATRLVKKFWSHIATSMHTLEDRLASGDYLSAFGRFQEHIAQDNASLERASAEVCEQMVERVRARIAAMASDACATMTKGFDYVLTHKEDGTVRFFATTTGLQNVFPHARFAGLVVLACIFFFRLKTRTSMVRTESMLGENRDEQRFYLTLPSFKEGDVSVQYPDFTTALSSKASTLRSRRHVDPVPPASDEDEEDYETTQVSATSDDLPDDVTAIDPKYILLSKAAVRRAFDLYTQQIQFSMQMQLRTIESSQQNIPAWVWVAMLVLGHNEFFYVATSPVLLLFIIIVAYFFFSQWIVAQWHRFEETGPQGVVLVIKAALAAAEPHLRTIQQHIPSNVAAPKDAPAKDAEAKKKED